MQTLKKRADFLRLSADGKKFITPVFILLAMEKPAPEPKLAEKYPALLTKPPDIRIGYTVTKKLGNAVLRNRIKRRFREAARAVFPVHARVGVDYVLIARSKAHEVPMDQLKTSLNVGLKHVHKQMGGR